MLLPAILQPTIDDDRPGDIRQTTDDEKLQVPELQQLPPIAFQWNTEAGPIPSHVVSAIVTEQTSPFWLHRTK